ncbi:MAG TPA: hypothetical protein PK614_05930, partial [Nitrospira sp.]|nr:hypothetical protein [Nitrospira sp.]
VIVMGSDPEKFFQAMDEALGAVSQAMVDQENNALHRLLFEALTSTQTEKTLVEAQLEAAQDQFPMAGGKGQ